jgi:ferrous iron transport protein B
MKPEDPLPRVAIVGNPNAGKTSLFNALTGGSQRVGNFPGVTVERVTGRLRLQGRVAECLDVPGLYSLRPLSADEAIAAEALTGPERPDLVVFVLDATQMERQLPLLAQVAETGVPIVVAVTMSDMLDTTRGPFRAERLAEIIAMPVVPVVAHRGQGINELRQAIDAALVGPAPAPHLERRLAAVRGADRLQERLSRQGASLERAQLIQALLQGEPPDSLAGSPELQEAFRAEVADPTPELPTLADRFRWAEAVRWEVVPDPPPRRRPTATQRLDRLLVHRVWGLACFAGVMTLVFQAIYTFAAPLMDLIDAGVGALRQWIGQGLGGPEWVRSAVLDGVVTGVGSALVFLPQIVILFFFIAVLEGSGYLARAAFLMDRLLGWCGLNGRAFIPLLSSYACAIPGIMAARIMPDERSRLATILVAPLMSCSARLPVYVLLIGAFIEPRFGPIWAGVALFAMHVVGLVVAVPVALLLNRRFLKGRRLPFALEMPPYQWPKWREVAITIGSRAKVFLHTAGTIIVVMSVVIWALAYFPRSEGDERRFEAAYATQNPDYRAAVSLEAYVAERRTEASFLGRFGRAIEPVFAPAGFDWRLTTAILAAFPAREVVVPSLGILFSLGGEVDEQSTDLRRSLAAARWPDGRPLVTPLVAVAFMVFFALCCQCMATLATIKRETGSWRWPLFVFVYMTILAYLAAVAINQIGQIPLWNTRPWGGP